MSLNTAHINNGVLIHRGECILIFSENITLEFSGPQEDAFRNVKKGRIYLTTHRMIFLNKDQRDAMQSFSFPFVTLSDIELEQPVFGANYIKGKVRAQPNGGWVGEAKFKLMFKSGGAVEFGQAMLRAAHLSSRNVNPNDDPPPYVPPQNDWYAAPPPAYMPPPQGYYGWVPPREAFPDQPPPNSVYVNPAPPPYPGLSPGYPPQQGGGYPPQQGGGYPPQQGGGYPPQQGGYGFAQGGYQSYGGPQHGGYPAQGSGGGYPPQQGGGYPPQQGGYPPPNSAAAGFQSSADAKAAEAAQSAYYDPNRPQMAYVPPPAYYENPPSYQQATEKKDQ